MFETVLFDLDGTLLDTIGDLTDAGNWLCRKRGWPTHTEAEFKQMVGNGIPRLVERFSPPEGRRPEVLAESLREFSQRYGAHKMDRTVPYPGVMETLQALRAAGVKTAVLSNKADDFCREIVQHYFPGLLDDAQGKRADLPAKPDPAGVFQLMERLGARQSATAFVGDSDVDIRTGRNAGLYTVGVLWGFRDRAELESAGAAALAADPAALTALLLEG